MLSLQKITITSFKNYESDSFEFFEPVVGICGLNGKGKTNLLDAIYYCCITKSYFSASDQLNIKFEKDGFRLEAFFNKQNKDQKLVCINRGGNKKELLLNDVPYEKISKHIGCFPVVMVAPDDIELITGKSEDRRKYLDALLSQVNPAYLQELISYNKILLQRNSLLKKMEEDKNTSMTVLEILDEQLVPYAKRIYKKRADFLKQLIPVVQQFYKQIAGNAETVSLQYISQLHGEPFEHLLLQCRSRDLFLQRSNTGIHKDDIGFELNGLTFKHIASQGQRKSLLFALKLAEFELLKINKNFSPLLLLDDVFEKLDHKRMEELLNQVCNENKGQVFITDTHRDRLEAAFTKLKISFQIVEL